MRSARYCQICKALGLDVLPVADEEDAINLLNHALGLDDRATKHWQHLLDQEGAVPDQTIREFANGLVLASGLR